MSFIKQNRSEEILEMIRESPMAFILLTVIAQRARREDSEILGLSKGQCFLGDFKNYGMTRQQYRTALSLLEKWKIVNQQTTNKGTIVSLLSKAIYDINENEDQPTYNHQATNDQPTSNQRPTTNKKDNKDKKEINNITSKEVIENNLSVEKIEYGNKEINVALEFLKKAVGITDFKESKDWQRKYTSHIVRIKNEIGDDDFKFRLKSILQDDFKSKNCNSLKFLFGELKSFIHSPVVETRQNKVSSVIF